MENNFENIRNNKWLRERFYYLKNRYFPDVEIKNNIILHFGRPTMRRLGSIKKGRRSENFNSIITINGHFKDETIPSYVVDAVLVHEFMHYAHGFASPHKQAFRHPHKGGVVDWDLKERGLSDILKAEKEWIKTNWEDYLRANHELKPRKRSLFKIIWR